MIGIALFSDCKKIKKSLETSISAMRIATLVAQRMLSSKVFSDAESILLQETPTTKLCDEGLVQRRNHEEWLAKLLCPLRLVT